MTGKTAVDAFEKVLCQVCATTGWVRRGDRIEIEGERQAGLCREVCTDYFEFEGEELVRFFAFIGPAQGIDPLSLETALRLNFGLPHGSIALRDDRLALVDTLLVDDPDPGEIEASVEYLAESAEHFEKTIFGTDEV